MLLNQESTLAVLQVVVDADAPWQNGKCERHGRPVKDLLVKGLETEVVFTPDDLEDLLEEIASLQSRRGNRGGFTPYHLVIGQNPRVPHELLSDDAVDEVEMQELSRDDADLDSPAKAFRQSMRIRDHARMLMETHTARERLRSAGKAQLHRDRNYHRGQGVYVWRRDLRGARDRTGGPSLSRWVGPGLVALQDGTTIRVSMRGRLWKCAREEMREATNHESLECRIVDPRPFTPVAHGRPITTNPDQSCRRLSRMETRRGSGSRTPFRSTPDGR